MFAFDDGEITIKINVNWIYKVYKSLENYFKLALSRIKSKF